MNNSKRDNYSVLLELLSELSIEDLIEAYAESKRSNYTHILDEFPLDILSSMYEIEKIIKISSKIKIIPLNNN